MTQVTPAPLPAQVRHLVIVLGDQLDAHSSALQDVDATQDVVWMAEVAEESTHVWSAKQRIAVFLSAMRHFANDLRVRGFPVVYTRLDDGDNRGTLALELDKTITQLQPAALVMTAPGDWRVLQSLRKVAADHQLPLTLRDDTHFFSTVREFAAHAKGRKQLRLEYWYRELRQKHGILMEGKDPVGGQWNFDADNRESFGKAGPQNVPPPTRFAPDAITLEVIALVNTQFASHPGALHTFGWPVTREQAVVALQAFIQERLPMFGLYEDAMWSGEAWLYHSHLSCALNLKLLQAREVVQAAEDAYRAGHAPLAAVEGFIRQILGWREYVRGIYWTQMPSYLERNALDAHAELPAWYWTGETDMACLKDAITQTLEHGYAHHIQRLMVTGLYALLLGVKPQAVHAWYLSVYVDAVEWVELPNTLGMSQFGDEGLMASKPYVASGKYIQRMSDHCKGCRYDPALSTGDKACPYTTLYWNFLIRHEPLLNKNPRMAMQLKNLARLDDAARDAISTQALALQAAAD
ncbi:cryptochrome/photolyase family protein [Rhodoferax saidenbachensis]|uniref:Cryptochrome/photolyase family protein n=1 Tax=Rhodoferax saidenbachensis TaxID=1484693 RepID=A0A1P8KBR0_9BURK|nr:cryptochrome/photolyase family protein [Rhodoferax saidenbachensis]APW43440.1 cryptochrome/photolyase family protein [Rhodoferax saidenbachensis]